LELSRHAGVKIRGMMYRGNLLLSDDGIDYENQWVVCHEPICEMDAMISAPKSSDFRSQAQRALVIALDC
jgi:hypothetical protein